MSDRLRVEGLSVAYGGVRAVDGVHLSVAAGEVVGLIGPNGAGKTTLIDAITGFVPCEGAVVLDGRDISGLAPHRRARLPLGPEIVQRKRLSVETIERRLRIKGVHLRRSAVHEQMHDSLRLRRKVWRPRRERERNLPRRFDGRRQQPGAIMPKPVPQRRNISRRDRGSCVGKCSFIMVQSTKANSLVRSKA